MGQKTVSITFAEARDMEGGLAMFVHSFRWMKKQGLDNQKPMYITPDYIKRVYYINGWEIEDAEETKN